MCPPNRERSRLTCRSYPAGDASAGASGAATLPDTTMGSEGLQRSQGRWPLCGQAPRCYHYGCGFHWLYGPCPVGWAACAWLQAAAWGFRSEQRAQEAGGGSYWPRLASHLESFRRGRVDDWRWIRNGKSPSLHKIWTYGRGMEERYHTQDPYNKILDQNSVAWASYSTNQLPHTKLVVFCLQ